MAIAPLDLKKQLPVISQQDHLLMLIVQAEEIGQHKINESHLGKLKPFVLQVDPEILKSQVKFPPVWVQKIITELEN